ncbi:hypothetical protein BC831DRAFT_457719 [Entophlyctis helioformis]|nr:hypothetical protein BC831DRAFT_457719 [Entophlyctis helioformis]
MCMLCSAAPSRTLAPIPRRTSAFSAVCLAPLRLADPCHGQFLPSALLSICGGVWLPLDWPRRFRLLRGFLRLSSAAITAWVSLWLRCLMACGLPSVCSDRTARRARPGYTETTRKLRRTLRCCLLGSMQSRVACRTLYCPLSLCGGVGCFHSMPIRCSPMLETRIMACWSSCYTPSWPSRLSCASRLTRQWLASCKECRHSTRLHKLKTSRTCLRSGTLAPTS